jgi:hypothetical protein
MIKEIDLLLCCARSHAAPAELERARTLLAGPIHWGLVVRLARRHRVLALLYRNLNRLEWAGVPGEVRSELHSAQQANAATCLRMAGELLRVLALFDEARIPAIPFKGVTLAARAYGDSALRDAGDIDLLVRRADVVAAVALLEEHGLGPAFPTSTPREADYLRRLSGPLRDAYLNSHCEHHLVSNDGASNVDLHWAVALREFSLPLNSDELWERATMGQLVGRTIPALSDEDLLLVLCVNGAKDCWERLDRVCDVAELIRAAPRLGWDRAIDVAKCAGARRMLSLGLSLARGLLGSNLPPDVDAFVRADPQVGSLTAEVRRRLFDTSQPLAETRSGGVLFHVRLRERWRDRVRYCAAQLRPGVGDWAGIRLPPGLEFLHYVIRPFRLAAKYLLKRQAAPPADRASAS